MADMILTEQEIFNTVARHLLTQKERAVEGSRCSYRNAKGLKCAVGCLISDDVYNATFFHYEGQSISSSKIPDAVLASIGIHHNDVGFVRSLQRLHDDSESHPLHWKEDLATFAKAHSLDDTVLQEFPS